ncbi:MAG: S9 family peptidase, partial [Flavobacteriaceae bacterium]|nr:S9 family peptidase [Flavobacteriaceae bacterium]
MKNLMRKLAVLLLTFCCLIACKKEQKIDTKAEILKNLKSYTIEQMMDNEAVFGGSFSPDKSKLLVSSNRSGIYNMYTVPVDGGDFTPMTASDSASVFGISYFPNDDRILFRMDGNGDEIFHLYVKDTTGSITELTPDKGARASFYGWAHDGKSFFYGYTKRNPRFTDVYEMNIATMTPKMIYQNDGAYNFGGISRDKQYMALSKAITTNDADLYVYNFEDKSLTKINENPSSNSASD